MQRSPSIIACLIMACLALLAPDADAQCNAPPVPAAGETVRWLRADSPFEICGQIVVPAGGTVVVDPGVVIDFASNAQLRVDGTVSAVGTLAEPMSFTAAAVWPPIVLVSGEFDLRHGVVTGQIRPDSGGTLLFEATTFRANGMVYAPDSYLGWVPPFIRFTRCTFDNPNNATSVHHCTVVASDCDFLGTGFATSYSYPWLDDLHVEGSPRHGISVTHDNQRFFVDNMIARNCAGGGIHVSGAQAGNDFFLGDKNLLEANTWPVVLGDGGLVAGSKVPAFGNVGNFVRLQPDTYPRGPVTLPLVDVPYLVEEGITLGTGLRIHPGVEVRFGPAGSFEVEGGNLRARGKPGWPVRFTRHLPGEAWGFIAATAGDSKLEHCVVEGSRNGVSAAGALLHVESCVLQDNGWGAQASGYNPIRVRGTQFLRNDIGAITDVVPNSPATLDLDGETNPNSFMGNRVAVQGGTDQEDAPNNWWGSPSGPRAPTNPGGTGDPIGPEVLYRPFRTTPPDTTDSPPFVTLAGAHFLAEPGSRQVLHWDVEEDRGIESQRVVLSQAGEYAFNVVIADRLPPGQRSLAWTVPDVGYQVTCLPAYVRVVAIDSAGQEGWDQAEVAIRSDDWIAQVRVTSDLAGTYAPGDRVEACFETDPPAPWSPGTPNAYLFLDGDRWAIPLGGGATSTGCVPGGLVMPYVSTDSARLGVRVSEGCNRFAWAFSDCFAIRPDPRVPDRPPVLDVTSPREGDTYESGTTLPIRWTASDDEALRSFDVLASYDAGRTWHEIVVDLPANATGHDWTLPEGETFANLLIRVIVRDRRFQDTSNACGVAVSVVPDCLIDADGDGHAACDDCAPTDGTTWAPPGEDRMLLATSKTSFTWQPPEAPGSSALLHDVLRTRAPSNFRDAATCLVTGGAATTFTDMELPGSPGLFAYLVRARNACSTVQPGSIGRNSFGVERVGRDCP